MNIIIIDLSFHDACFISPVKDTIVTNDRWCDPGCKCLHGGTWTCKDHYNPGKVNEKFSYMYILFVTHH